MGHAGPPAPCPCGRPGVVQLWEATVDLCAFHARSWLLSEEKRRAGAALMKEPPDNEGAKRAVEDFIGRIEPWHFKVKRWFLKRMGKI